MPHATGSFHLPLVGTRSVMFGLTPLSFRLSGRWSGSCRGIPRYAPHASPSHHHLCDGFRHVEDKHRRAVIVRLPCSRYASTLAAGTHALWCIPPAPPGSRDLGRLFGKRASRFGRPRPYPGAIRHDVLSGGRARSRSFSFSFAHLSPPLDGTSTAVGNGRPVTGVMVQGFLALPGVDFHLSSAL